MTPELRFCHLLGMGTQDTITTEITDKLMSAPKLKEPSRCRLAVRPFSLLDSPGRRIGPLPQLLQSPSRRLVLVTDRARIWNFVGFGHGWRDKSECMTAHVLVTECLLDLWHMTSNAFITWTARFVMCVLFDRARMWSVRRAGTMTFQAHHVCRLYEKSNIVGSVNVMTARALYTAGIHYTLHKIVPLHPVFMRCSIGEVRECGLTQLVFFQFPKAV